MPYQEETPEIWSLRILPYMKSEAARAIVTLLDKVIRTHKRGIIMAVNRLVKRGNAWWHQRSKAGDLSVGQMMAILEFLGKDPVRFMREAVGSEDGLELDRPPGEPPELVVRAWKRFHTDGPLIETAGESNLKTLDTMRYEKPREALAQANTLVDYSPRSLLPRLLGVTGSAWRLVRELDNAEHAIYAGLRMAQELGDQRPWGDLLQRYSYIFLERAELERALRITEKATLAHLRCANRLGVGRTLVDQGLWLRWLGKPTEAIGMQTMALEWLPKEEIHNRAAALLNMGWNHRDLGNLEEAVELAERAEEEAVGLPRVELVRVRWLRGNVLADLKEWDHASRILKSVVNEFAGIHLGEMAMAACDLAEVHLAQGEAIDAFKVAKMLTLLVEPLKDDKLVLAAIADVLRDGEAGVTLALVQELRRRIEGELKQRNRWRRLWVEPRA